MGKYILNYSKAKPTLTLHSNKTTKKENRYMYKFETNFREILPNI